MIIDGTNLIVGRVGPVASKRALEGETVDIINCERMVITGNKKDILAKYKTQDERGEKVHGPFLPKMPDRLVKRMIRGMLSYKKERGREAYKRIKCHIGVPVIFKDKKAETIAPANISKTKTLKYISVGDISKYLGKKW